MRTPENSVQANSAEHLTGERQALPSSTLRCPLRLAGHGTSTPVFYEKWGFVKGNPEPAKGLWSHRQDASLADPQGSASCGWEEVSEAMERAASTRRDGKFVGSETVAKHATAELAYVVEVEHLERPRFTEEITPYALRVTMIFRLEEGVWKVVHRHADQITTAQSAGSVIQK